MSLNLKVCRKCGRVTAYTGVGINADNGVRSKATCVHCGPEVSQ